MMLPRLLSFSDISQDSPKQSRDCCSSHIMCTFIVLLHLIGLYDRHVIHRELAIGLNCAVKPLQYVTL